MAKVIIVYESKYGNTKQVAQAIAEGIAESKRVETVVSHVGEVDINKLTDFDAILIRSPNHVGRTTGSISLIFQPSCRRIYS